jgi:tetratricopeptide (TPR) repeat protein
VEQAKALKEEAAGRTVLSDELRDSNESANDSAKKAMEALRAARAAVEEARSLEDSGKFDPKQAKAESLPKPDPGADKKGTGDGGKASKSGSKSGSKAELKKEDIPPLPKDPAPKASSPKAESPAVSSTPPPAREAQQEPAAPKPAAAPAPAPATAAPAAAVPAPAPAPTAAPATAPAAAAPGSDAPKLDGVPATEGAAPPKRKSRFAADSDSTADEGGGRKKSRSKKEPAVPLTPEQAKAAEIKAFCDKARAAIKKGEYEVAQGLLESLVAVDLPHSEKKVALQEVATVYEERGDLTKPIAIYEKLSVTLDTDPDVPAWLLKLGQLYRDAGAYQMAISRYYGVIQLGMKMGSSDFTRYQGLTRQAQREVANTYFMKGDFEQAQKFYNMALRSDLSKEERAVAMFRSAHCTFMRNDMNGAVNALERFLKDFSRHASAAEARYMLATAYKNLGRPQDAYDTVIELLREAKGKAEADPKAWAFWQKKAGNEFANDYYQRADFVNAVTIYQALAALETSPEWRWPVVYQMGLCFERLRLEPRAVECYKYIVDENTKPEFRWKKMPQSVGNLVKMAAWRVEQLAWEGATVKQLRSTAGNEVLRPILR